MIYNPKNKKRYKPYFKQLNIARENVRHKKKLLKFKKKKWKLLQNRHIKALKWFNKNVPFDQEGYPVVERAKKGNSYRKRYRSFFQTVKGFKLFYGDFLKKYLRRVVILTKKNYTRQSYSQRISLNTLFIKHFESRLDVVLYRAKFCHSIRAARQLIGHGKVEVNKNIIFCKSYTLNPGDLVSIKKSSIYMVKGYFAYVPFHEHEKPHPPAHLYIGYRTFSIVFGTLDNLNLPKLFTFNLKAARILLNFLKK